MCKSLAGGRFQRLVFDAVLVRLEQQLVHQRLQRGRQRAGFQFLDIAGLHDGLLLLLFDAGQRGAQRLLGRGLVAPAALFIEVDRRVVQGQHQAGGLERQRGVAEVFGAQFGEPELVLACDFPQEFEVDIDGDGLGLFQQLGRARLVELQQHVLGLDLGALTARHLHLVRLPRLRQHGADLEIAGLFEK
jgi:hypothetical protein